MAEGLLSVLKSKSSKEKPLLAPGKNELEAANPRGPNLQILVLKKYGIPGRPDVEIERTIWGYRQKGKRLARA